MFRIIILLYITLFQIIGIEYSNSQQVYFNNRYNLCQNYTNEAWSGADGIIQVEDGYIIAGYSVDTIHYWWRRIPLMKMDLEGTTIWEKSYGDTIADYYTGQPGSFIKGNNNRYYIAGVKRFWQPENYATGYLMVFDENFDTLWTRNFNLNLDSNPDTNVDFTQMVICYNNDFIFSGSMNGSEMLLLRTDSLGNMLWYKTFAYSANTLWTGYSVIQTSEGGFAIGGFRYTIGYPETGDPIVIKTDSLGNQEWIRVLGGPFADNKAILTCSSDGNILVGTVYSDEMIGYTNAYSRIHIIKMTNDNAIIWDKKFGESTPYNFINNISEISDGSIICSGSCYTEVPYRSGWVFKISHEGDSVWYRRYKYLNGVDSQNRLHHIIQTDDNGFIACGYADPSLPDTGIREAWVIKLDSIGCEWAGCDTTVSVPDDRLIGRYDGRTVRLEVWPNPARDLIRISLTSQQSTVSSQQSIERWSIEVYDIFGRKVSRTTFSPSLEGRGQGWDTAWAVEDRRWRMDVSALPVGLYLLVVKEGDTVKASTKFVVAR